MTDSDLPAFMDAFKSVMVVFNVRQDADIMAGEYFKALRGFPLTLVSAGGDKCKSSLKRFPKPAEWKENIPRATAPGIPLMTTFEAGDHREAEACFYEMPPCGCADCRLAGVDHRPIRYVPDTDEPKFRLGESIVVRGHWAHGWELRRWYDAKESFWAAFRKVVGRSRRRGPGFERLKLVQPPPPREPGEDDV